MTAHNGDRAGWALEAVEAFRAVCNGSTNEDGSPDIAEAVGDLVADLMHLCDQHGIDPVERVQNGVGHYVAEKLDPDGMSHAVRVTIDIGAKPYGSKEPYRKFNWRPLLEPQG